MALTVSTQTFESDVVNSNVPVLVDFWAPWCGPCRAIAPALEELSNEFQGRATVAKLDIDENPAIAEKYGIISIPALLVFKNGEVVDRMVGAAPKAQLSQLIQRNL